MQRLAAHFAEDPLLKKIYGFSNAKDILFRVTTEDPSRWKGLSREEVEQLLVVCLQGLVARFERPDLRKIFRSVLVVDINA